MDTKEEAVGATAVEVRRRVAQRRLKQSASSGAVDADLLLTMKERNRDERKTQMHDNFEVRIQFRLRDRTQQMQHRTEDCMALLPFATNCTKEFLALLWSYLLRHLLLMHA